ncbi:MAG: hypothetical protein JNK02_01090 [Planctomycetes bacterium]|nr:hypothetical protein [Planctomycetota bacterium]
MCRGPFSCTLLARYRPETGPRDTATSWLFVALTAGVAPVGLIVPLRFIRVHGAGHTD